MQTRNETYSVISCSATHLQLIPDNYNDFQKLCRGKQLSSLSSGVQGQLLLSLSIAISKDLAKIQFAFWNFSPKQYLPVSLSVPESLPQGVSLTVGFLALSAHTGSVHLSLDCSVPRVSNLCWVPIFVFDLLSQFLCVSSLDYKSRLVSTVFGSRSVSVS